MGKVTFATSFCLSYTRKLWPNAAIVRQREDGVEVARHNGQLGLAYREEAPLFIEATWFPQSYSPSLADDLRRCANRIDAYMLGRPDTDGADEWYAREAERMRERAPA